VFSTASGCPEIEGASAGPAGVLLAEQLASGSTLSRFSLFSLLVMPIPFCVALDLGSISSIKSRAKKYLDNKKAAPDKPFRFV
jgi:hypothetical protein